MYNQFLSLLKEYTIKPLILKSSLLLACLLLTNANAELKNDKVTLKPNMMIVLNEKPSSVDSFSEAFTEGKFYGRLRTNMFMWDWKNDTYPTDPAGSLMDNKAMGVGGSFLYKTAPFKNVSATVGFYTSQNPTWFRESTNDVSKVKAGKDTFSRYDTDTTKDFGMTVLAQSYLQYDLSKTTLKYGRQIFESVFTKSNDTKMIPNTFNGFTLESKDLDKTTIQLAYLDSQKLRDHTKSHDVIAFAGGAGSSKWRHNDDAAVNKNLTVARVGDNNELWIASVTNKSIKNLQANVSYLDVPSILSNLTLEAHYAIELSNKWKVIPGFRYMKQFDKLSANYDVANLGGKHDGYTTGAKQSLDTDLLALRVDVKKEAFMARFGYSKIADKADIVAPWRGFPTGGFTRAMAQYNWYANTKTYMFRAGYDFGKAGILEGFNIFARYAIQDFDDKKTGVTPDSKVVHVDMMQNVTDNLQAKIRIGLVDCESGIYDINSNLKSDVSYNEYRFELNYLF